MVKEMLCYVGLLSLVMGMGMASAEGRVAVQDVPFYQDISHRATYASSAAVANWEVLPFSGLANSIKGQQGKGSIIHHLQQDPAAELADDCYLALSAEGVIFSSARNYEQNKLALENPYGKWQELLNFGDTALRLAAASKSEASSFYVITKDNIAVVNMMKGSGCSTLDSSSMQYILMEPVSWGDVYAVTVSTGSIWIASSSFGLSQVSLSSGRVSRVDTGDSRAISSLLWVDKWNKLFVGSSFAVMTLFYDESGMLQKIDHEWVGGIIDSTPLDMCYDEVYDAMWLAESNSVHKLSADGRWWRYGQHQGSPNANITSVSASNGFIWVGSDYGVARVRGNANPVQRDELSFTDSASGDGSRELDGPDPWTWMYYYGNRYLSDNKVVAVVSGSNYEDSSIALVVCLSGLAVLESSKWTLSQKSKAMEQFQNPRHNRHGLVSDVGLNVYGDVNSYYKCVNDNDGLWTSMHAMAEAYRFASTGEPDARSQAWEAFEALEMLSIVTGSYPTFPARSFCLRDDPSDVGCGTADGTDRWHNSTVKEGYMWKDDTSSDEIDGHLAAYPLIYDLVAQTPEEKMRVMKLIDGITGGIVDNDLYLIDPTTGKPTTWGFWNPSDVNDIADHYSERGGNSLEILAFLTSAYSITENEKYLNVFWDLANNHGYVNNAANGKIDNPLEDYHSDNELMFLAYHILFYSHQRLPETSKIRENIRNMVQTLVPSIERTWSIISGELSPLWLSIYAGTAKLPIKPDMISNAVWSIRHWAIDLIEWPIHNSDRWDITISPFSARDSSTALMRQIRPPQERQSQKWNSDPFVMNGGSGYGEKEPAIWRLPYYLMVFNKLIVK